MGDREENRRYMSKFKTEKIKSRNLSEKKRRDQFNLLINELSTMVCSTSRKMDKSSVLRATIAFLKNHSELSVQSQNVEVQENWKPSFLSNEEFTHLMLEALNGFILVFSCNGQIMYSSESTASLLGYLPSRIYSSVFDIVHEVDKSSLYKLISNVTNSSNSKDSFISMLLHMKRGPVHSQGNSYELVNLLGYFHHWPSSVEGFTPSSFDCDSNSCSSISSPLPSSGMNSCFVALGCLQTPHLLRLVNLPDDTKNEFTSRHSLEWKFLFLDHRAPPIIGYLPFEVLGTSGYDYYHVDDLDKIANSHELLMQTGEGTSCFYRFLTKGQQWIWLQTRYYISYHQWNSKPEFIVCTHTVVSSEEVIKSMQETSKRFAPVKSNHSSQTQITTPPSQSACISPSPSVSSLGSLSSDHSEHYSAKTPSSSVRAHSVLYLNPGGKDKAASASAARPSLSHAGSARKENFMEPRPNLISISPGSDMNLISSTNHIQPGSSTPEHQVYASESIVYSSASTPSSIIISTNVSGSQFHGERVQPSPEQIQYLSQRYQMLQQTIMQQQEELKRVSQQLRMAQYANAVPVSLSDIPYQAPDVSSMTSYVNTYSVPSSSSMSSILAPIPVSYQNVIKSAEEYTHVTPSYSTSRPYRNVEAELCSVGTSDELAFLSTEQDNGDIISENYNMAHSMPPNS